MAHSSRTLVRPNLAQSRPHLFALGLVAILATYALAVAPAALGAEPGQTADVPRIMNGPEPRDGTHELQLEEIWRRGGEDDEDVLLGIITSVKTDSEGNLYVLDAQLMEVKVFDAEGELTGTLGRQGEGPGEFTNAQQLTLLPGGESIGVAQTFPGKLVCLKLDGTPDGEITMGNPTAGGFVALINTACAGDNLVVSGIAGAFDQTTMTLDRHHFVRSYDRDGTLLQEYFSKDVSWDLNGSFTMRELENDFVWWRLAVDPQGRVLVGEPREDYLVSVYNRDGSLERVFGREYETWKRNEDITARFESMMEAQSRQLPPGTELEVAENAQDIWGIHCHNDGTYWVTTSRGMYTPPEGVFTAWDVFSAEGEYIKEMVAKVPGKPGVDLLFMTDHGYAVMVTGFWDAAMAVMGVAQDGEAEPMEIICYRIM